WGRQNKRHEWALDGRLAGDVAIAKHDVGRIDEAGDHEERLTRTPRLAGVCAQPADRLARDEGIVVKAAPRVTADVPTRAKHVEAVGLEGLAVVDRRFGFEELLVHLELAEVGSSVAKP